MIVLPAPGYGLVHTAVGKFVRLAPEPVNVIAVTLPLESTVKPAVSYTHLTLPTIYSV